MAANRHRLVPQTERKTPRQQARDFAKFQQEREARETAGSKAGNTGLPLGMPSKAGSRPSGSVKKVAAPEQPELKEDDEEEEDEEKEEDEENREFIP